MIINHNINAMTACKYMNINLALSGKAMQRLSSGQRINSAADDPAGLCISENMRAQIRGLQVASRNVQDGISLIQTEDGALTETHSMLQRLRELAVQAANGTYTDDDRKKIQKEVDQLTEGINRIACDTEFNAMKLLDSSIPFDIKLQVGANTNQSMKVQLPDMRSAALKISGATGSNVTSKDGKVTGKYSSTMSNGTSIYALDVSTRQNADAAIKIYDDAINVVSSTRSSLGAMENALEHRINYLDNTAENLTAAESRIRDADMAKEMMNFAKYNILYQVCQAMFIQANKQGESIIELLKSL